ncbi:MAG: hypothetical protein M1833_000090 [Piccolia ochrophora]|nr:MAG: hypothetical protein M1833_000090 [Piccolia ochrophora]
MADNAHTSGNTSSPTMHNDQNDRVAELHGPAAPRRHRSLARAATLADISSSKEPRRSSFLSDYSLDDARQSIRSSTDDLLLPRAGQFLPQESHEATPWHSAPLAFALLPAIGGILFTNGSAVVTDVTLLGIAAIFLNWSVRLPWDWYHSSQSLQIQDDTSEDFGSEHSDVDGDDALSPASDVPSPGPASPPSRPSRLKPQNEGRRKASRELHAHESLALLACFVAPLLAAYLLHAIRSQLSRPSEGLVSNYNLTIFLLAAELRPMSHLVKLIQERTLHLQRIVNANPHASNAEPEKLDEVRRRLEELEARTAVNGVHSPNETKQNKSSMTITAEVRRTLQPDLDALNRAVRRYEKRATLQTMQTESRLSDLEGRLNNAIALAAAAAQNSQNQRRAFSTMLIDWTSALMMLPLQGLWNLISLPATMASGLLALSMSTGDRSRRERKAGTTRVHGRVVGDRGPSRLSKKG